jgi:succinate dehydrogenase / fumarate reductase flavoprotein subunit
MVVGGAVEHQTPDNEAKRDDDKFCHVAIWEHQGKGKEPKRHTEALDFENIKLSTRSYK